MTDMTDESAPAGVVAGMPVPDERTYLHLVNEGRIKALMNRLLRRAPRTMCGESLEGDPDEPGPGPHSPFCTPCVQATGRTRAEVAQRVEFVPGRWIGGSGAHKAESRGPASGVARDLVANLDQVEAPRRAMDERAHEDSTAVTERSIQERWGLHMDPVTRNTETGRDLDRGRD